MFSILIKYYHCTGRACFSRSRDAVDQLNLTNWGKPNTGSMIFLKKSLVNGSINGMDIVNVNTHIINGYIQYITNILYMVYCILI